MIPKFGPIELVLILVIVTMLFGVGKLPEVFGSVGRGIREFRKNSTDPVEPTVVETVETVETVTPVVVASAPVSAAPVVEPGEKQATH